MKYCKDCQEKKGWPQGFSTHLNTCESCKEKKECFNIPRWVIEGPFPKNTSDIRDI